MKVSNTEPMANEPSAEPELYPVVVTKTNKDGTKSTRIEMYPLMTRPATVSMQGNKLVIDMQDFNA